MSFKFRKAEITFAATTASATIGLGAAYGRIHAIELKGDDTNVDTNTTYEIVDADGRVVLTAVALDAGTTDTANATANHTVGGLASIVGVIRTLSHNEAETLQSDGTVVTDNVGAGGTGVFAKSPVTVNCAAGTSGDVIQVGLFVEV